MQICKSNLKKENILLFAFNGIGSSYNRSVRHCSKTIKTRQIDMAGNAAGDERRQKHLHCVESTRFLPLNLYYVNFLV